MRPLVAHCHLGLGKLYRRTGKREGAGAPRQRDDHVPCDGHAVLAGEGGGRGNENWLVEIVMIWSSFEARRVIREVRDALNGGFYGDATVFMKRPLWWLKTLLALKRLITAMRS